MLRRPILAALTALALLALPAPVRATDFLVASSVGAGAYHSCALTRAGEAYCWGYNFYGELGDGTTTPSFTEGPRKVIGGHRWRSLSVGEYTTCGITVRGDAYCWGENSYGQLGDGTTTPSFTDGPRKVIGGHRWRSISIDESHACGLTARGEAYCWGYNNYGELGDGTTLTSFSAGPQKVIGGLRFASIDVDTVTTCGITAQGEAYCWGDNGYGQLGDGTTTASNTHGPRKVIGGFRFAAIDAGYYHSCGVAVGGSAYCWGSNEYGELGDGTTSNSLTRGPQPVIGGLRFRSIDASYLYTCGVTVSGDAYCWGYNEYGQVGDGTNDTSGADGPQLVIGGIGFSEVRTGWYHACGVSSQGATYCWGYNGYGELGDGTTTDSDGAGPQRVIAGQA